MSSMPKSICILPWKSMEVTPMGTYKPCCLYNESIPGMSVQQGHTINDAQTSDYMKALRQEFLDGKHPQGCSMCWQEESVPGRMSKRKVSFHILKGMKESDFAEEAVTPLFLDLKLGNICNLKCRICGSWSSSKWAQEELELSGGTNELTKSALIKGQWPRKTPNWWKALDDAIEHIQYLEFTGGEPFLIDEHFDMLEFLVEKGHAHKIRIHYNSNSTTWPQRGLKLWPHFKLVQIAFSIDDTGKRFEYQRHGATWAQTQEVVRLATEFRENNDNVHLQICTTFNVQNAYYWADLEKWILSSNITDVHYNILHGPPQFNLRNLPDRMKASYAENMRKCTSFSRKKIEEIIQFMELPGEDRTSELKALLLRSDLYRNELFEVTHPEIWDMMHV